MSVISSCNTCIHLEVCEKRRKMEELLKTLDNIDSLEDYYTIRVECKFYYKQSTPSIRNSFQTLSDSLLQ